MKKEPAWIIWKNLVIFLYHFFSVGLLTRTLFSPWKRAYRVRKRPGLHLDEIGEVVSFNLISSVIGSMIRATVIGIGVAAIVVTIGIAIITSPIWMVVAAIPFGETAGHENKRFRDFMKTRLGFDPILNSVADAENFYRTVQEDSLTQKNLFDHEIDAQDILFLIDWWRAMETARNTPWYDLNRLLKIPTIGKTWAYGYTPTIDAMTIDLSAQETAYGEVAGRQQELAELERILIKTHQGNVILMGESGVGKHPLVITLAHAINSGNVMPQIEGKRVLSLNLEQLFTSEGDGVDKKATLTKILEEAEDAGNIILVLDAFDRFIATSTDRLDLTDAFMHILSRDKLHLIAMMTQHDYHRYLKPQESLANLFEIVTMEEPNAQQMQMVLVSSLPTFEKHGVIFRYSAIKAIIELTQRYLPEQRFPEKAFDLAENITANMVSHGQANTVVDKETVVTYLAAHAHIPISVTDEERHKLLNLNHVLHERVIGQDKAIDTLVHSMERARADIRTKKNRPLGAFLFLGPTGMGKTEMAKAITQAYFGSEDALVRFDMNAFSGTDAISSFLGNIKTGEVGLFADAVREKPFCVILLDEFEKAPKDLMNMFLTVLDEGYVTDAFGKKVFCTNTIIIATSNAGAEFVREHIDAPQNDVMDFIQRQGIFTPELLNRFDSVVLFESLSKENIEKIIENVLTGLNITVKKQYGITINLKPETRQLLMEKGFSKEYGGRYLLRAVQEYVETPVSELVLARKIKRGEVAEI